VPVALTEFGVNTGVSQTAAASILGDALKLTYGDPDATGFFMWGFHQESGAGATTLFAPSAALYTVSTTDFNAWTLTPAGQKWQDMLGIQDWDGNANNGWTTQTTATVGTDGTINFNGFWGDYDLTVNGHTYHMATSKGTSQYSLVVAPGDFNGDHVVDAADYVVWRETAGSAADLRADGNGDGAIDQTDYDIWRSLFGTVYSSGAGSAAAVPEPSSALMIACASVAFSLHRRRNLFRSYGFCSAV
jgi:hypothetical protein